MKFSVLQFPGSNSDQDCVHAVLALGHQAEYLWHRQTSVGDCEAILIPGGFSYGDYLRAGAVARHSPILSAVIEFARAGGLVLGICNGFQILCEAGLLPGALVRNRGRTFRCEHVFLRAENRTSPFTCAVPEARTLKIPIAHGEGCYVAEPSTIADLERHEQVLWRYTDADGRVSDEANPNGSLANIAGIGNREANVAGLMPHPERACEPLAGSDDGKYWLESMIRTVTASQPNGA